MFYEIPNLNVGDIVKVTDGSYAERLDAYEQYTSIGLCRDEFKVIKIRTPKCVVDNDRFYLHDIHIQNCVDGRIYLHSSALVKFVRNNAGRIREIEEQIASLRRKKEQTIYALDVEIESLKLKKSELM